MPTTNPVPSTDPSDLLFNAGKLDEVVSGTSAYYTDRLGVNRRTIEGINASADVVLAGLGYAPPVAYTAGISLTLATQTVEYAGEVYAPKVANLPFTTSGTFETAKFRLIQGVSSADLPALVGQDLQDYAALRAYIGRATRIYITGLLLTAKPAGIAGVFQHDQTDTTSADNGGTVIVGADGRRWKRQFEGPIFPEWFGAVGNNSTDNTAIYATISSSGYKDWKFGPGTFIGKLIVTTGLKIRGSGYASTTLKYSTGAVVSTNGARVDGWDIDEISIDGAAASNTIGIEASAYSSKYRVGVNVRINNCGSWAFKTWGGLLFKFYAQGTDNGDNTSTADESGFAFVTTSNGTTGGSVATTFDVGGYAQSGGKYGYRIFRCVNGIVSGVAENFAYALHGQSCSSLILLNFYSEANTQTGETIKLIDTNVTFIGGRFQEEPSVTWVNVAASDRFSLDLRNRDIKARYAGLAQINLTYSAAATDPKSGAVDYQSNHLRAFHVPSAAMQAVSFWLKGTTAQRPVYAAGDAGESYYDTTLGKPIWWSGTAWKDAAGTTV